MSETPVGRTGRYRGGPGRPPGRKNNRTLQLEAAAAQAIADLPDVFEGDAHAFLSSVYKNTKLPLEIRILAAGRALRVEKPVLSAVQGRVDVTFALAERLGEARKRAERARLFEIDGAANQEVDSEGHLLPRSSR